MGKKSEQMKAIVAVSLSGMTAITLRVWPAADDQKSPWWHEFEAVGGSDYLDDLGLQSYPKEAGLWVWEGYIYYCGVNCEGIYDNGPEWNGSWRRATDVDMMDILV